MLHSENGSPNPLCYHQNLLAFDLVMASRGTCPRATRIIYLGKLSLTYAGYGWETRAPVSPACFLPLGVYLPLSQKHAVRKNSSDWETT